MELEVHDEAVTHTPSARSSNGPGARSRPVLEESIMLGSGSNDARPDKPRGDDDEIRLGVTRGRALSANAQRMLANIDKHDTVDDEPPSLTTTDESPPAASGGAAAGVAQTSQAPVSGVPDAAAAAPAKPVETPPAPDPTAEHRAVNERLAARNRELVAENERLLKGGGRRAEPSARDKALDEIERGYLDDPIGSIRKLQALALGIDDPKHADVDAEMQGFYADLTSKELQVPLDESKQAKREAARTRNLLARDKREQKAASEAAAQPKDDPEATRSAQMHSLIGNRLSYKQADGKSLADKFPLLTQFAADMTGSKPEAILWDGIRHGIASGELTWDDKADVNRENDRLIDSVATQLETRFQDLVDRIAKARTPTSTARPTPAADEKAQKETGNSHGPRTITNASASVAPATPPAAKAEPTPTDKPKWKNEKERRLYFAKLRAGET